VSPARTLATAFGVGLAPVAPGTFGTLAAWPLGWWLSGTGPEIVFPAIVILFVVGIWACHAAGRELGAADHGSMVWDEVVAFLLILAVIPRSLDWQAAAFLLFRAFDIAKPWPIREFEARFKGGFGVMADDLIAAGYTLLVLAALQRIFF
jgi:phosphatidylglycerophosphatase A